ncbi:hypothetical protein CBL_00282 [Carabus blaptoides fortunei]
MCSVCGLITRIKEAATGGDAGGDGSVAISKRRASSPPPPRVVSNCRPPDGCCGWYGISPILLLCSTGFSPTRAAPREHCIYTLYIYSNSQPTNTEVSHTGGNGETFNHRPDTDGAPTDPMIIKSCPRYLPSALRTSQPSGLLVDTDSAPMCWMCYVAHGPTTVFVCYILESRRWTSHDGSVVRYLRWYVLFFLLAAQSDMKCGDASSSVGYFINPLLLWIPGRARGDSKNLFYKFQCIKFSRGAGVVLLILNSKTGKIGRWIVTFLTRSMCITVMSVPRSGSNDDDVVPVKNNKELSCHLLHERRNKKLPVGGSGRREQIAPIKLHYRDLSMLRMTDKDG